MKVWLGCATQFYCDQPGNKNRPWGAMKVGHVILVYGTQPAATTAEWTRCAWVPVEIGDVGTDIEDYVAACIRPDDWDELNAQAQQEWRDDMAQKRRQSIANLWAEANCIDPAGAPRLCVDVAKLKAEVPEQASKLDKAFDPAWTPAAGDIPAVTFGQLLDCCTPENAQYRADRLTEQANVRTAGEIAIIEKNRQHLAELTTLNAALAAKLGGAVGDRLTKESQAADAGAKATADQRAAHEILMAEQLARADEILIKAAEQQSRYEGK